MLYHSHESYFVHLTRAIMYTSCDVHCTPREIYIVYLGSVIFYNRECNILQCPAFCGFKITSADAISVGDIILTYNLLLAHNLNNMSY